MKVVISSVLAICMFLTLSSCTKTDKTRQRNRLGYGDLQQFGEPHGRLNFCGQ